MVEQPTSVRGLVVDDDPEVVDLLTTLLRRRGIAAESAEDGDEASELLRANEYDLAFIDLILPDISGERLLREIEGGLLKRPVSLALISAASNLANVSHGSWARNVTLLSKPFASADVATFIDRAFRGAERETVARPIVFAGGGLWLDAAKLVAERRGGRCLAAADAAQLVEHCTLEYPLAVVLGPPIPSSDMTRIAAMVKSARGGSDIAVFAALPDANEKLTADLLTIGVDRVVSIGGGVLGLADELLRIANLRRRIHRRVAFEAPVLLRADRASHVGRSFDIAEGGIGVELAGARPASSSLVAEFMLPGEDSPIEARTEVAWADDRDPARPPRLGLRFTSVSSVERIRSYVAAL